MSDSKFPGGSGGPPAVDYGDPALLPHDSAGPEANAVAWSLLATAGAFLGLRLYCKYLGHRGLWWDDKLLIASWVIHMVDCALLSVMVAGGYGKHPWDSDGVDVDTKMMLARNTFTQTAAAWSKTAFAVALLRLGECSSWLRPALWFVIVSLNVVCGLNTLLAWVGCTPVQKSWDPTVEGTCLPPSFGLNSSYVAGAYSAACDFVLAALPCFILWNLHMRKKEKLGVVIAMSMGAVAGIMATVKTVSLTKLSTGDSYDAAHLFMLDTAEISVTIMAASIPAMRVLFRDMRSSARREYDESGRSETGLQQQQGHDRNGHSTKVKPQTGGELFNDDSSSDRGILGAGSPQSRVLRVDEVTAVEDGNATASDVELGEVHIHPKR
ncbi:hypothetical protein C8A01DRAFT_36944 [Parachaetomium inaequale]|uniref:Rhodopsin domain-containing protein n=1 Tax=Parachaetomium inaequale TaxID=2588326 RepID=A0AAN6SR56_9PEZI|nr:hypothetical protein C8A01DRAFT_36944 [Parachaetomium inaequale]